ncbi:MAG TPA: 2-oxo-4-hydroxy-4-carboxy-5-ureidoimidazoline decarboxylase [Gemmataceae bacterium]|jgi:2-oxo-4-hydroxy-4-carboxy-5-ureidoimidazoline decarboxylase|nr:2-oxo-4-hydroxy-4-carboxy-5-ureidoimidazoline decarboxylase [Gemmataceae bacterium]
MADLAHLNEISFAEAQAAFMRCCGSQRWAEMMAGLRPFATPADLFVAADAAFANLARVDWLEAFAAHPRIGDLEVLRKKFATTAAWCASEQSGVVEADDDVLRALADGNQRYEERFGYLFIVCAAGKGAAEMLEMLRNRLENAPADEFSIAAGEQALITRLRLEKL